MSEGAGGEAPFRLEQDGSLTHLILEHPPLNLFDAATFDSLEACVGELAANPPRGVLVRAVGRVVSAGVDVAEFEQLTPTTAGQLWMRLVGVRPRLRSAALPDDLQRPLADPDRGVRALARLRPDRRLRERHASAWSRT